MIASVLLVALVSFGMGLKVGFQKAMFSSRWGENFERNFMMRGPEGKGDRFMFPPLNRLDGKAMRNGHGAAGEILSLSGNTILIKNPENQENTIRINESTLINRGRETIAIEDLKSGDRIVVIGKPQDDGVIAAHLIRVFPGNL